MAARWGAGEEILSACNMERFSSNALDEEMDLSRDGMDDLGLDTAETLGALQSCLDPSILSMFEDSPPGEGKSLDEESEATLLTALTEILDNVDDENLSPFDTLPDSDLLSAQKGREHSPLRRLLCLSRSPLERDTLCSSRPLSTGKTLPRSQAGSVQRSDGEEEEDGEASSLTLSPDSQPSSPAEDHLGWGELTLPFPIALEGEQGDGLLLSLGDLVRHMHPYCMAVCVEDGKEQILPEGGILLEVVDQGEHGEPILAIPDLCLSISLPEAPDSTEISEKAPEPAIFENSDMPLVDDVTSNEAAVETADPVTRSLRSEVRGEKVITRRPKEETVEKGPSRRKKKRKEEMEAAVSEEAVSPVEGRVLRSASARRATQESPVKPVEKKNKREKKKKKVSSSVVDLTPTPESSQHNQRLGGHKAESHSDVTNPTLPTEMPKPDMLLVPTTPEDFLQPSAAPAEVTSQSYPTEALINTTASPAEPLLTVAPEAPQDTAASQAATASQAAGASQAAPSHVEVPPTRPAEAAALPAPEPKPKPLSLQEYRLLRQQKKPAPVEKPEDHSTKWPSIPEAPTELPPIPCLPDPSLRDPRRPLPQPGKKEKEEVEVKPAWQPMGPFAPPTPEALLAPPAYMVASSNKTSSTSPPKPGSSLPRQADSTESSQSCKTAASSSSSVKSPSQDAHAPPTPAQRAGSLLAAEPVVHPCPVNDKPALLQSRISSPGLAMTETRRLSTSSVQSTAHAAPKDQAYPQPVALTPAVLSEAPSKTTTVLPTPTGAVKSSHNLCPTALKTTAAIQKVPTCKPSTTSVHVPLARAARPLVPYPGCTERPVKPGAPVKAIPAQQAFLKAKNPTQELIEAFTTEIGIEAADLTSLLEQFEETQAKEEQWVPEVSGRAAAVGNSSVEPPREGTAVERVRANDLASTAALTPPATPPHQMWKPLAAVALLGKSKRSEGPKPSPSKAIQIDARPLPSNKQRSKAPASPPAPFVDHTLACLDHDYCLPPKEHAAGEPGKRWNVKQQPSITIKTIEPHSSATTNTRPPQGPPSSSPQITLPSLGVKTQQQPLDDRTKQALGSSVLETPEASPTRLEVEAASLEGSPRRGPSGLAYQGYTAASRSPSPREKKRGRSLRRRSSGSSSRASSGSESDSCSSGSRSCSPPKKRYRRRHSESSSSSSCSSRSSPSVSRSPPRTRRCSYSSSHSGSWSCSRSRSPPRRWRREDSLRRPGYRHDSTENNEEMQERKQKAIEERRIVYVGRIRGTMTRKELRERFSLYGEIEECTLHFRDRGDNYGFVTYYDTKDAFTAIENGGKLRKPDELPFDLCFGGRRQFCRTTYADLDSNREYEPLPVKGKFDALDFDTLLKQAQKGLKR